MTWFVSYVILDLNGMPIGAGASIEERFVLPRSLDDVERVSDNMTDAQRRRGALGEGYWLSVTGWSEMGR